METAVNATHREPWNKCKIVGQKAPFKPKDWRLAAAVKLDSRTMSTNSSMSAGETRGVVRIGPYCQAWPVSPSILT